MFDFREKQFLFVSKLLGSCCVPVNDWTELLVCVRHLEPGVKIMENFFFNILCHVMEMRAQQ